MDFVVAASRDAASTVDIRSAGRRWVGKGRRGEVCRAWWERNGSAVGGMKVAISEIGAAAGHRQGVEMCGLAGLIAQL